MGLIFGKQKPKHKLSSIDKSILQLKQNRDKLKQYQLRIENSIEKDRNLVKLCLSRGQKDRAKLLLRKKTYQTKLLENADQQLNNLETLVADIEFAQVEMQVVDGLKQGNAALKKIHEVLSLEEVERVLDETAEGIEKQNEIDEMLAGALTQEDEDDVMAEFEALTAEDSVPSKEEIVDNDPVQLPDVPTDELPAAKVAQRAKKEKVLEAI